jgi:transposase
MSNIAQSRYKKESAREFKRRRGVQLMAEGENTAVIARVLGVAKASLYRWQRMFTERGDVKFRSPTGRPRKLSADQIKALGELLLKGATAHGWPNELWTSDRVAAVIKRHFNVTYSHSNAWVVVTRYLGWTVQRPVQRFVGRNEELIKRWKTVEFPRILHEVSQKGAHLVFFDESGFMLTPTVCRTFAPRGQRPVIKVAEGHARISAIGAISISPIRRHLSVFHHLLPDYANFRADSVMRFVSQVGHRLSGPIIFVCDACPIHCTNLMLEFLSQNTRIEIEEFPPHAPEINPVDKIWAYFKHSRLANYTPSTLIQLRDCLTAEFSALQHRREVLAWCVREAGLGSALTARGQKPVP